MTNANALTKLKKARRVTLSAQIVEQMETCIKDGVWPIGEKVPSEMELMETFGVSRNTVREAILALVYAGILQSYPGDGTYVLSDGRLDAALQLRIKAARLSEIVETRMISPGTPRSGAPPPTWTACWKSNRPGNAPTWTRRRSFNTTRNST